MEEAAQEVRRILRQNDVGETLHYLSTVSRSIDANQHDLRAIIGNSYRDLLAACDGVVGMERDCADILTIEEAVERASAATRDDAVKGAAAEVAPLLPASWFAASIRRQRRHAAASAAAAAQVGAEPRSGAAAGSAAGAITAANAAEGSAHKTEQRAAAVPALPVIELPLPNAACASLTPAVPASRKRRHGDGGGGEVPAATSALAERRLQLDDALQALHLGVMAVSAASAALPRGAVAVEAELSALLGNARALASLPSRTVAAATATTVAAAATHTPSLASQREQLLTALERDLPLLRLARRLRWVQMELAELESGPAAVPVPLGATSVVENTTTATNATGVTARVPPWVPACRRRATTLETRLVKLLLHRLRRAADDCAWFAEQRADPPASVLLHGQPRAHETATTTAAAAGHFTQARQLVYVWVVFAQCHGALRALADSPTLISALTACAPAAVAALSGSSATSMRPLDEATTSPASPAATLEGAAAALQRVAEQDPRRVVASIAGTEAGTAAQPCRLLLAFLSVVLLRESQVTAARWATLSTQEPAARAGAAVPTEAPVAPTAGPRVFATAAHRAALGLGPACASAADGAGPGAGEGLEGAAGRGVPNTAWALRCFAGLSSLFRGFADYIDLTHAFDVAPSTAATPWCTTDAETRLLQALQQLCAAEKATDGSLLWGTELAVQLPGAAPTASTPAAAAAATPCTGARSLEELLQWRLRHATAGGPTGDGTGAGASSDAATQLLGGLGRGNSCSPAARERDDGKAAGVASRREHSAPLGGIAASLPPSSSSSASPSAAAARRRAYVELLRASVNSVDELQATAPAAPRGTTTALACAPAEASGRARMGGSQRNGTDATAALAAELRTVWEQLLTPLVSSLVVLLARDPVALTLFGTYCSGAHASAAAAARDALRRHLEEAAAKIGLGGAAAGISVAGVGQTWSAINARGWWEQAERATLGGALQRCVTVALESVSFVELCIMRGLAVSAHCALHAEEEEAAAAGAAKPAPTPAAAVDRSWSLLFAVLQLHALSASPASSSDGGVAADAAEAASPPQQQNSSQQRRRGSSHPTAECGGSATVAGIDWDRLRPSTVRAATAATAARVAGAGIFGEEVVQWGRAACRAAQLPLHSAKTVSSAAAAAAAGAANCAATEVSLTLPQQRQLTRVLSGMRRLLVPHNAADAAQVPLPLNGHAAELLHCCLLVIVDAVLAQKSSASSWPANDATAAHPAVPAPPTPTQPGLYTRIVEWVRHALARVAALLRDAESAASPPPRSSTPAAAHVVLSYELSLLVRVYSAVLQRLRACAAAGTAAEAATLQQLCAEADGLYVRTQAPWQTLLVQSYDAACQAAYGVAAASSASGGGVASRLADTSAWARAPAATAPVAVASAAAAAAAVPGPVGRGIAYPAQPTAALAVATRDALRRLHQAMYGCACVYGGAAAAAAGGLGDGGAMSALLAASHGDAGELPRPSQVLTALHALLAVTEGGGVGGRSVGDLQPLVAPQERQRVRARLSAAVAQVYTASLLPTLEAAAAAASAQSRADEARLQLYLDAVFVSAVWDATAADASAQVLLTLDAAGDALEGGSALMSVPSAQACITPGELRAVAARLERQCDPLRWQSSVPLMLAAFRRCLVASAMLWAVHGEPVAPATAAAAVAAQSVAEAAALRPFAGPADRAGAGPGAIGGAGAYGADRLLAPRAQLDRLPLLPIAVSSNAALAAAAAASAASLAEGASAGMPRSLTAATSASAAAAAAALAATSVGGGGGTFTLLPPTTLSLNPYASAPGVAASSVGSAASGGVGRAGYRLDAFASNGAGTAATGAVFGFGDDYAALNGVGGAAGAGGAAGGGGSGAFGVAGANAAAAAAASSLWGTTQRGWNQLWGSG